MSKQRKSSKSPSEPGSPWESLDFSATPDESSKTASPNELNLADHFLIAMPSMLDPVFGGTVVYLCEHNANGALGVIINKPTDMTVSVLLSRIDLKLEIAPDLPPLEKTPVMYGGPVQADRGFVLHAPKGNFSSTMPVTADIALTTSKDILEAVALGAGPQKMLVSLGCSGWGAGQLEDEITRNGWLTVRADPNIMFDLPLEQRFVAALKLLGIDPMMLSGEAGHA
ncbi:YqgE/AlgH family protein [Herminiimonas fonticola]|uniref:YqgE/AlgH family protein n=1 Tax=Herminiimonas fonticola TaxID=303380 RepID=UPI00333FA1A8